MLPGLLTAFLLGLVYFLAAIPAAMALGTPAAVAAASAWLGYTSAAGAVLGAWVFLRSGIVKKIKRREQGRETVRWLEVARRWGLPALALAAPVTIGPYFAALAGVMLRHPAMSTFLWVSAGGAFWSGLFALAASFVRAFTP